MNKKFISSVTGASIFISITGLFSKGLGFVREIIFASLFGLSSDFDLYLVAAVLPLTINTIVLYIAQNYLIPANNKNISMQPGDDNEFIISNFLIFFTLGIILSLVLFLFSKEIISLYLNGQNTNSIATAVNIFRLFLISIPINCAISVLIAYQQTNFEFRYPAYSQLLLNTLFIFFILIFAKNLSIFVIPLAYNTGIIFQLIYLLRKSGLKLKFIKPNFRFKNYRAYTPGVFLIIILIESISQLYVISDRYFYNYIPTGGIAALNYAQTVFLLPISVLSIAISTAIFPRFAQQIHSNSSAELESVFNKSIRINVTIFIPVTILFFFYGDVILKLFFQRGKFTGNDAMVTYNALIFFSISTVFYATYNVMNKLIYSMGLLKKLLYLTIGGICLKILLNFLLIGSLKQNGLALSTSISYVFFFSYSFYLINRQIIFKHKYIFLTELLFSLGNAFISLFIVRQIVFLFFGGSLYLEIILFLLLFTINIFLVNHSFAKLFFRLLDILKGNLNYGSPEDR